MATTVKLHVFERNINKKTLKVPVYIRLTHERKPMYLPLNTEVDSEHFDFQTCQCTKKHDRAAQKNAFLAQKLSDAETAIEIVEQRPYTPEDLKKHVEFKLKNGIGPATLMQIAAPMIAAQKKLGRVSNAQDIENVVTWFNEWNGGDKPMISITFEVLNRYKIWLLTESRSGTGVKTSTVRAYFMAIQGVFSEAKRLKQFPSDEDYWPFIKGLIPPKNKKGKVHNYTIDIVKELEKIRPTVHLHSRRSDNTLRRSCDFALLQFYLHGTNFVELSRACKDHIIDGYWIYQRYKNRRSGEAAPTGKVKITDKAYLILAQYNHPYLLIPILDGFPLRPDGTVDIESNMKLYDSRRSNYDTDLKKIGKLIGTNLNTTTMRYLWASRGRQLKIDQETIDIGQVHVIEGMGAHYTNYDKQADVDAANELIQTF